MDTKKLINKLVNELEQFSKKENLVHGYSNVILFEEFLRRLAVIYKKFDTEKPFSINFYLLGKLPVNEEIANYLTKSLHKVGYDTFGNGGYFLLHSYIYWEIFKVQTDVSLAPDLLNLYEPLIKIFERGGYIGREMKIYDVCGIKSFRITNDYYSDTSFIVDLSDDNLSRIDDLGEVSH